MQLTPTFLLILPLVAAMPLNSEEVKQGGREALERRARLPTPEEICKKLNTDYDVLHDFDALTDSEYVLKDASVYMERS